MRIRSPLTSPMLLFVLLFFCAAARAQVVVEIPWHDDGSTYNFSTNIFIKVDEVGDWRTLKVKPKDPSKYKFEKKPTIRSPA